MVLPEEDGRRQLLQGEGVALPADLAARGWKLIIRAPDRLFAVSASWGCTETLPTIGAVIAQARGLTRFCEHVNKQRAAEAAKEGVDEVVAT